MLRPEAHRGHPFLGPVAERIQGLHHPIRTRILLELAGDVDALVEELKRTGVPEEEAVRLAAERLVPSGAAVDALVRLHLPLYLRLSGPVPDSTLRRWERGTLLFFMTLILGGALVFLGSQGLLNAPSHFLWAVLALAGGVVGVVLVKSFRLLVRRDHQPETLDRGLRTLLVLSGSALAVAGTGTVTELWILASALEVGSGDPTPLLTAWLIRGSVLLTTALLTALAGSLAWFLFSQEIAAIRGGDQEVRRTLEALPTSLSTPSQGEFER